MKEDLFDHLYEVSSDFETPSPVTKYDSDTIENTTRE